MPLLDPQSLVEKAGLTQQPEEPGAMVPMASSGHRDDSGDPGVKSDLADILFSGLRLAFCCVEDAIG